MKIIEEPVPGLQEEEKIKEEIPETIVVEPVVEEVREPEISRVASIFKRVFLKREKKPVQTIIIPAESANLDEAFFEALPPPELKPGFFAKVMAPVKALFYEKKVIKETGLSTRQRIKRYNASMEGSHGVPDKVKKGTKK
jgi:hypothetical protein